MDLRVQTLYTRFDSKLLDMTGYFLIVAITQCFRPGDTHKKIAWEKVHKKHVQTVTVCIYMCYKRWSLKNFLSRDMPRSSTVFAAAICTRTTRRCRYYK